MCGIFCSISRHGFIPPSDLLLQRLKARGPDACQTLCFILADTYITLTSTVLALRGDELTQQPHHTGDGSSLLCWNGEAWRIKQQHLNGSDTARIHDLFLGTLLNTTVSCAISEVTASIEGPFSFVFLQKPSARVHFGRDALGRRSLLRRVTKQGDVLLSSITDDGHDREWLEVDCDGIYSVALDTDQDVGADHLPQWGAFPIMKEDLHTSSERLDGITPVIQRISVSRHVPSTSSILSQHSASVSRLHELLRDSLSLRITNIPEPPTTERPAGLSSASKLAILFSGGLDCTVVARICDALFQPHTAPIDLLNVAFENPRVHKNLGDAAYEKCPDRITGRASHAELIRVCPQREWRFIAINIPYSGFQAHRAEIVALMRPHDTEMDMSIASALYFASRGRGVMISPSRPTPIPYATSARVLLSGLGADELFAGYTRHATAYDRHGYAGLIDELDLDISRLGRRNLGRDDRVTSHWAKEVRYPFLDETLLNWALSTPVTEKCGFGQDHDSAGNDDDESGLLEPGKKVLRCLAWSLGMTGVAKERKRAASPIS